jgi:hypothetical protein
MKLIRHYFKYDFLRWRALFIALWALAAVYVGLTGIVAGATTYDEHLLHLGRAIETLLWLLCFMSLALSVIIGRADSPVMPKSWQRTRPRFGRALLWARSLLLVSAVVLPLVLTHGLTVRLMNFPMSTVLSEMLRCSGLIAVWVFAWTCIGWVKTSLPGLILGLVTGFASVALASSFQSLTPAGTARISSPAAVGLGALIVFSWCLFGRKPRTARQWVLQGYATGFLLVLLPWSILLISKAVKSPESNVEASQAEALPGPIQTLNRTLVMKRRANWDYIEMPWDAKLVGLLGHAQRMSWRRKGDTWSAWIPVRWEMAGANQAAYTMILEQSALPKLDEGEEVELRWAVRTLINQTKTELLSLRTGEELRGDGWNFVVTELPPQDGKFRWSGVGRSLPGEASWNLREVFGGSERLKEQFDVPSENWHCSIHTGQLSLPCFNLNFMERYGYAVRGVPIRPERLLVTMLAAGETQDLITTLTNVRLRRENANPAVTPRAVPIKQPVPLPLRTPRPWSEFQLLAVPGPTASEVAVADYLQGLSRLPDGSPDWKKWTRAQQLALNALVPQWWPLFIEVAKKHPGGGAGLPPLGVAWNATTAVKLALAEGTPESRRDEFLAQIPAIPTLALLAARRGWQAEAKPYILQVAQREHPLPTDWPALLRSYRDPRFHPALRREFVADVPSIRYWESMPDLAPELPTRLAAARAALLQETDLEESRPLWALVESGDAVAFELMLKQSRFNRSLGSNFTENLRRTVRAADGESLSALDVPNLSLSDDPADYHYNPARRCWIRHAPKP